MAVGVEPSEMPPKPAHTPFRRPQQPIGQQATGHIGIPDVILRIQRSLRRIGQRNAADECFPAGVEQHDGGFIRMVFCLYCSQLTQPGIAGIRQYIRGCSLNIWQRSAAITKSYAKHYKYVLNH
jgi:hypothetical protein